MTGLPRQDRPQIQNVACFFWPRDLPEVPHWSHHTQNLTQRNLPCAPVVTALPSSAGVQAHCLVGELKSHPHALWPKSQNIKQKQNCNKINKVFKHGPGQKKKKPATGQSLTFSELFVCSRLAPHGPCSLTVRSATPSPAHTQQA